MPRSGGETAGDEAAGPSASAGAPSPRPDPSSGFGAARRPAAVGASSDLRIQVAGLQGRRKVIPLAPACAGVDRATVEHMALPVVDVDDQPYTFTFDAVGLDLGTRSVSFDCGDQVTATIDLLIYRQTQRRLPGLVVPGLLAGAVLVALASTVGAGSTGSSGQRGGQSVLDRA